MKPLMFTVAIGLFILMGSGCKGSDGPVGPMGPPGEDAVISTATFTFDMDQASFNEAGDVASAQFDVPSITRSVVDNGLVMVYFREFDTWTAMPFTYGVESSSLEAVDYTISMGFAYEYDNGGFVEVFYEASTPEAPLEAQPDRLMKAVVIDGYPVSKAGLDLTDYEAVKAYFGLED